MYSKCSYFKLFLFLFVPVITFAQSEQMLEKIYKQALNHGQAYAQLEYLTKQIGNRIAGSEKADQAVRWSYGLMKELSFDTVYLQDVDLRRWDRGDKEVARIVGGQGLLTVLALGGSVATPAEGIEAGVIEIKELSDLDALDKNTVKGKIVFLNKPWNESLIETGVAYGQNSSARSRGPVKAASMGAVAYLFRSLTSSIHDYAHTGGTRYNGEVDSIPAMSISPVGANRVSAALKENPELKLYLKQNSGWKEQVATHNVIAEWRGTKTPDRIITIGGHIDSWDVGEGAHDNGTGTLGTLDAIRTLMKLGYKPQNTIRLIFYMNEENGLHGAIKYGETAKNNNENIIAAIESDAGGFAPRGFDIKGSDYAITHIVENWKPLFEHKYWVSRFLKGSPGVDSGVWGSKFPNAIMFNFRPDPHRYFDLHHSHKDVFEAVDKRELQSGVGAISSLLYLLDQHYDNLNQ